MIRIDFVGASMEKRYRDDENAKCIGLRWVCSLKTVLKRLKARHVQIRQGMPPTVVFPCTDDELKNMYDRQGLSIPEITKHLLVEMGFKVSIRAVTTRLKKIDVNIRSNSESKKLKLMNEDFLLRHLEIARKGARNAHRSPRHRSKNPENNASQRKRETRTCTWDRCDNLITRKSCDFRSDNSFCCHSHASKHQGWLKRQATQPSLPLEDENNSLAT